MEKNLNKYSLLAKWKNKQKNVRSSSTSINKLPEGVKAPLSSAQKRFWFLQQMYPESAFYNLSERYDFKGDIDSTLLEKSIQSFFAEQDIFKSYFTSENGKPKLNIANSITLNIEKFDFSKSPIQESEKEISKLINKQAHFKFNLTSAPLLKVLLIKKTKSDYILFFTAHHIIADQWSMSVLKESIAKKYKALLNNEFLKKKEKEVNFFDFAFWQNNKQGIKSQLDYWKNKLPSKTPIINLPHDFKRPNIPTFKGSYHTLELSKEASLKISNTAKQLEVTPFVFFLSIYFIILQKFSQQEDILIGTPISNRSHQSLEDIFGLFIDTLVVRTSVNKSFTIKEFINKVKNVFSEAVTNKDVSFNDLVQELNLDRSLATNPLFQVMFVYSSKSKNPDFGNDLTLTKTSDFMAEVSKFDLTLFITDDDDKIASTFEYSTDLFKEETIIRLQEYLKLTISYVVENIDNTIANIPALTESDKKIIDDVNVNKQNVFAPYKNIHTIIENVSKSTPNKTALTFNNKHITYSELNERANNVAHKILEVSSKSKIVGLCLDRSLDMIIGLLGILKSGCAYLPIDPEYPEQRISYIINDAQVDSILTHSNLSKRFIDFKVNPIIIDKIDENSMDCTKELPKVKDTDLAYIIYTSGSTGAPKGVPISHKNIIASTAGRLNFYDENPTSFLLMSSISFDSSKAGIFWTLCTGGNLVITQKRIEQDIELIANLIHENEVSHTLMLPSLYKVILDNVALSKLESLNTIMVAGDACTKELCNTHFKHLPNASLYNEYGPTEATVWCTAKKITQKDLNNLQIGIGQPTANSKIHILDTDKKPVPVGVSGEIYVGGNLSEGYLNKPELTNTAFINSPFNNKEKIYKTGDLGKFNNDGSIQFLGRTDQQIKIRGFRVELDDIENTIDRYEDVKKSVVIAKNNPSNQKYLVAFIKPNNLVNKDELKKALKKELPHYMIPTNFIVLDNFPLLPNGKIDRKTLNTMELKVDVTDSKNIESPKNEIEEKLLTIWEETLNISPISTKDNFFEIGGDSILSIQIISKARKSGLSIAPSQIFEHKTIAELAMFIVPEEKSLTNTQTTLSGKIPLTPIQKWFFETHKNAPNYWNQGFTINNVSEFTNSEHLETLTNNIIKTQDALRLSFYLENNEWVANILKPEHVEAFHVFDISDELPENYNSKIDEILIKIQNEINLNNGALFKCIYFDTGLISQNIIVIMAHHLVIDFVSWQIILDQYLDGIHSKKVELNKLYRSSSIQSWGNHLNQLKASKEILKEQEYWKKQITKNNKLPTDFDCNLPVLEKDVDEINIEINSTFSDNNLNKANQTYSTKTDELLLTAFTKVVSNWADQKEISLALERHGRETNNTSIDLSNTVGWFTSFFPQVFNISSDTDIESSIIRTKEQIRTIPNGGIGFGILRYLNLSLEDIDYPNIVFNFLGKQAANQNKTEFIKDNMRHPSSERYYFLEVNSLIKNGVLEMSWQYSRQAFRKETILSVISEFEKQLNKIIEHCTLNDTTKYTPSDFQDVDLDQDDLDTLLNDIDL